MKLLRPSSDKDVKKKKEGALSTGSVIVYVWRQKDAEVITEQLRSYDIEGGIVCYHGGMDANSRTKSQGRVRKPGLSYLVFGLMLPFLTIIILIVYAR